MSNIFIEHLFCYGRDKYECHFSGPMGAHRQLVRTDSIQREDDIYIKSAVCFTEERAKASWGQGSVSWLLRDDMSAGTDEGKDTKALKTLMHAKQGLFTKHMRESVL